MMDNLASSIFSPNTPESFLFKLKNSNNLKHWKIISLSKSIPNKSKIIPILNKIINNSRQRLITSKGFNNSNVNSKNKSKNIINKKNSISKLLKMYQYLSIPKPVKSSSKKFVLIWENKVSNSPILKTE